MPKLSPEPNHYGALGIEPGATNRQIDAAYRLCYGAHLSGQKLLNPKQQVQLTEAYTTLSNGQLRREYDKKLGITKQKSAAGSTASTSQPAQPKLRHTNVELAARLKQAVARRKKLGMPIVDEEAVFVCRIASYVGLTPEEVGLA